MVLNFGARSHFTVTDEHCNKNNNNLLFMLCDADLC